MIEVVLIALTVFFGAGFALQTVRVRRLQARLAQPEEVNIIDGLVLPVPDDPRWVVGETREGTRISDCYVFQDTNIHVRKLSDGYGCTYLLSIELQEITGKVVKPYFEEVKRSFLQRKSLEGIAGS